MRQTNKIENFSTQNIKKILISQVQNSIFQ